MKYKIVRVRVLSVPKNDTVDRNQYFAFDACHVSSDCLIVGVSRHRSQYCTSRTVKGESNFQLLVAWFEFQVSVPAAVQWAESRQLNQAHQAMVKAKCFVCSSGSGRNLNRFCNFFAFHGFNNVPLSIKWWTKVERAISPWFTSYPISINK